ncbi:MAG: sugar phosphate nucleotidyltransferase [Syntrophobacterales bacterium]
MYAVIMAGGKGTRFWPRSRQKRPKQLLNIVGRRSMLQQTVARITSLLPPENIIVVAGEDHGEEVHNQLAELPKENIILEPVGRNTAACIGLAALLVQQRDSTAVMAVLPADHLITDEELFLATLRAAVARARLQPALITLGIRATAAETGYGYIEAGEQVDTVQNHSFYKVISFHEKPGRERAPGLYSDLQKLKPLLDTGEFEDGISRIYPDLESISIDYGVMEKADNVLMIPADFGWNDLGTWASMVQVWPKDDQNNVHHGEMMALDSRHNVVFSKQKLCVLLGVENLIVVDTEDALLVCPVHKAQDIGKILEVIRQRGMEQYL